MRNELIELIGSNICEDYSSTCDEWQPHSCEKCYANNCAIGKLADNIIKDGWIKPPCRLGDKIYFYKAELNEICPATVVGIYTKLHTPSTPFWIDIVYKSRTTGKQQVEMVSDVFKLLCYSTKEEIENRINKGWV